MWSCLEAEREGVSFDGSITCYAVGAKGTADGHCITSVCEVVVQAGHGRCVRGWCAALSTPSIACSPAAEPQFRLSLGQTAPHRLTDALTSTRLACAAVAT